ncbi:MAG: beta-galactosidase [Clostridia bacterium]|nr:beta-galactosidase [Clostridia bacterium]
MANIKLEIHKDGLTLGGEPFYIASGDMHYFRFFKEGWRRRLQLMKDFGLTTVQTYVPWNLHEPEKGQFNFDSNLNLKEFFELCKEIGIYVLFRPSGYMCSEWDFGGLPYWLLKERDLCIRTSDPKFMAHIKSYYERLAKEFVPYLSTNGGPIIAVAVENEYGSFGDDYDYMKQIGDILIELGVDVPLFTANGWEPFKLKAGSRKEYWNGLDLHALTEPAKESIMSYQPDKPIYIGEFWGGRSQQWGGFFARQTPEEVAEKYKDLLEKGAYVNFYMFCGGTNFGFQNGALVGRYGADVPGAPNRYIPFATSYDVDAPITEYGRPTRKYELCKKVLAEYLEKKGIKNSAKDFDVSAYECKTQSIPSVKLDKSADMLSNIENIAAGIRKSGKPLTFEDMDQAYGFMLYSTYVAPVDDRTRQLNINGLHDRALVFGNGEYLGCYMRDREMPPVRFTIPEEGMKLDILVESTGRVNYGTAMLSDYKGITDYVRIEIIEDNGSLYPWNYTIKTGWTNASLPLKDISNIDYSIPAQKNRPAFFSGEFEAEPGVDTFFNPEGWNKGVVWINGFNLGRYWKVGPQGTLYVPGELLKEKNTIQILELHKPKADMTVSFDNQPSLDLIENTVDLVESVVG